MTPGESATAHPWLWCGSRRRSALGCDQPQALQSGERSLLGDLLSDLSVLQCENGDASEAHLASGVRRQLANRNVRERRSGMRATAIPTRDDSVAFCDEVAQAPEVQVG